MNTEAEIYKILSEITSVKEKLANAKEILKSYKIKSDKLTELKRAKKELQEQINEEKDRIENELYEDKDYEQAKNDELTYKNQMKEKASELRVYIHNKYEVPGLKTEDHNIKGDQIKLQCEFAPKVYINGKEI